MKALRLWSIDYGNGNIARSTVRPTRKEAIAAFCDCPFGPFNDWNHWRHHGCRAVRIIAIVEVTS